MHVGWLRLALQDLDVAAEFISTDSPQRSLHFLESVFSSGERLMRFPSLGRPGRASGTCELVLSGTPDIVPYRMRGDVVQILRVLHAAREWPAQF